MLNPSPVMIESPAADTFGNTCSGSQGKPRLPEKGSPWVASARFLLAWLLPSLFGLYLKWYAMKDLGGFEKVARLMGFRSLPIAERLSFFRGDVLIGFLIIPLILLVVNRYVATRWAAIVTGLCSIFFFLLFAIQLRALEEVGRYISMSMILMALRWGLHEPGANVEYLSLGGILAVAASLIAIGGAIAWSVKNHRRACSRRALRLLRVSGEFYLLCIVLILAIGWKSAMPATPYHKDTFSRAVVSLWNEGAVDTGEFSAYGTSLARSSISANLSQLSSEDLIARYRQFAHAPAPLPDHDYFGKENGDNIIFFVFETLPDEFLPADDDMKQFPNLARLRQKSFIGDRQYTTCPATVRALFSVFSSWYPMDSLEAVWGYPSGEDVAPDFLPLLNSKGYRTAAFTPLRPELNDDQAMYRAVGFDNTVVPDAAVSTYDSNPTWKAERIAADLATLDLLESNLTEWMGNGQKFAAAFLPQVGHFPYPDSYPADSTENVRERGRAIVAMQDAWLGRLMDLLQKHGQLDKTIIVVLGDHGRRNRQENPSLRRGTIDETAFHVPLLIYAPRALDHPEHIPWMTSHIDVAPTVLDLLGIKNARDSEQGTAIWNPALAGRTTFFFAQPVFGADGYQSDSRFYMWHYFSDSVYMNSSAAFDMNNFVLPWSPDARTITSEISTMAAIEKVWHARFAKPDSPDGGRVTVTSVAH